MDHDSAASLPPGVRFQPNEDELCYYLTHKVYGKPLDCDPIDVVDVYKSEPWDLRSKSRLKTSDREWYFFSALGRKYRNHSRINRTTEKGYWKTTGKDREVRRNSRTVRIMKKILVFFTGRGRHAVHTNWVMHEYRLVDEELEKAGIAEDALVLCKIFQKSGTGPKNGEASFGEEVDMGVVLPGEEAAAEEAAVVDGEYVKEKDLDQDKSNYIEYSGELIGDYQQTIIGTGETSELHHDHKFVDIPKQYGMDANSFRDEFYIEVADLSKPMEVDPADFDMDDGFLNLDIDLPDMDFNSLEGFYPSEFLGTENTSSHQTPATHKNEIGDADQVSKGICLSKYQGSNDSYSSKDNPKALMDESGSLCSLLFPQINHFYSNRNPNHNSDIDQCNSNAMDHDSATSLPPGYRFQPNEDEICYYLNHKVSGKPLDCDLIDVVDVYKSEPWDLRSKSRLKMSDREWYFFSALGRKCRNGSRINRTTEKGYWKTTGKDREVRRNSRTVRIMKKVLVFFTGRGRHAVHTNWVMHEYRLVDEELEKAGIAEDVLVLCKIFQKSGTGPKNGEASFGEEDDMGGVVPGEEAATEEAVVGDGEYVKEKDLDQDKSNYIEYSGEFIGDYQQTLIGTGETSELHHDQKFVDIPEQYGMGANSFRDEFYIEVTDLSKPMEVDPADFDMADGFLNLDVDLPDMDVNSVEGFYPSEFLGTENTSSHQTSATHKNEIGEADQVSKGNQRLSKLQGSNDSYSSKHNPKA